MRKDYFNTERLRECCEAFFKTTDKVAAARVMEMPITTYRRWLEVAKKVGIFHEVEDEVNKALEKKYKNKAQAVKNKTTKPCMVSKKNTAPKATPEAVRKLLSVRTLSTQGLAEHFNESESTISDILARLEGAGINVQEFSGRYTIPKEPPVQKNEGKVLTYVSRPDNTYVFGAIGDTHLCSKYCRLDVLKDMYDFFEKNKADRVFHTGNWIDGEARFNKYDIEVHGMEQQLQYMARHYPARGGIKTYAITGDDHEGWYCQQLGVDIGKYAENVMRDNGREDWVNCGYMEASVVLKNYNTGAESTLLFMHPGGGSSYAISYTVQQLVNSLEGGEKPDVMLVGHYHKLMTALIRGVYTVQTGSTKDQDPFMRKKRIDSAIGGYLITLEQDPKTGAIIGAKDELRRYFNRGFYEDRNGRWSHSGGVNLPKRSHRKDLL